MSEVAFGTLLAEPLRNGVSYPSRLRGEGTPMINMREIFAYDRIGDVPCELVPLTAKERETSILREGDLLFARQSLTYEGAGKASIVLDGQERTWDSHLIRARLNASNAWSGFFFYYFRSPEGRRRIETIINQVAAAGIRGSDLAKLLVPLPPINQQRAIAEVLEALDDKIAANDRLARTADELMRARFSAVEHHSMETLAVGEIADNVRRQAQPAEIDESTVYLGLEHVPRHHMWMGDRGSGEGIASAKFRFEEGDTLFGKLRPYFHKVIRADEPGVCSTDILVVRAKEPILRGYLHAAVSSDAVVAACTQASEGTRMPRTSWKDLAAVQVPWPGEPDAIELSTFADALADRVRAAVSESRALAELRDTLLPALMSGRLSVKTATDAVEATA